MAYPEGLLKTRAVTPQAVYATGRGRLTYIYSKDCNRDVAL